MVTARAQMRMLPPRVTLPSELLLRTAPAIDHEYPQLAAALPHLARC